MLVRGLRQTSHSPGERENLRPASEKEPIRAEIKQQESSNVEKELTGRCLGAQGGGAKPSGQSTPPQGATEHKGHKTIRK